MSDKSKVRQTSFGRATGSPLPYGRGVRGKGLTHTSPNPPPARYSLGFALSEQEKDDGRMHELVVRVKALDAKGKQRKLEVSSRRGYYMPKSDADQAAANK